MSRRRWIAVPLVLVLLLGLLYGSAHLLTGRYAWARAVAWLESDIGDQQRFPARTVPNGDEVSQLLTGPEPAALTAPVNVGGVGRPLDDFLEETGTRAFLVVHDDRLVYERYFDGVEAEELQTSFSAAKSFVSTLVGIAVDEGLLEVTDPVTAYLPELEERDERFADITIGDLLTMSSGIRYAEDGMPWSDDALTYYGTDLRELALTHTRVEEPAGGRRGATTTSTPCCSAWSSSGSPAPASATTWRPGCGSRSGPRPMPPGRWTPRRAASRSSRAVSTRVRGTSPGSA